VIRASLRAAVLAWAAVAANGGCAESPAAPVAAQSAPSEPRWQDVFDGTPELLLVVFPRELRQDKVYGSLLRRALEMARESSNAVAETHTLDAMEAAEEVIIGVRPRSPAFAGETIVVVRGAPSDVDPARLVDTDGHPLWMPGPLGLTGGVREFVRVAALSPATATPDGGAADDGSLDASLFELPGATWVIASGAARARAGGVLARPASHPGPPIAQGALAAARLDGASLVQHLSPLRPGGLLSALGRRLRSATVALPPGAERAVRVTLAYADEGAATGAETQARVVVATVAQSKPDPTTWLAGLSSATISRAGTEVTVQAPLPERLIDVLLGLNRL
jgi:hypothetical protein